MTGFLIYADRISTAGRLADLLDAHVVLHPEDAREGEAHLAAGSTVVARLEAFNSGVRLPDGCQMMFLPECRVGTREHGRAVARGLICGATPPFESQRERIMELLVQCEPVRLEDHLPPNFDPDKETAFGF